MDTFQINVRFYLFPEVTRLVFCIMRKHDSITIKVTYFLNVLGVSIFQYLMGIMQYFLPLHFLPSGRLALMGYIT